MTTTATPSPTALKPSQLRRLLAKTIPARRPVLISGAPGVGKTDIGALACDEAGAALIVSHPVVNDPTDYKGMPWVVDGRATFLPFGDLEQLLTATRPTVFMLDDLGQATPAVQAAAMQLILARRINGHAVSEHVTFLACTNRRQDRAGVSGILEPVKSRFITSVELVAHLPDWNTWAVPAGIAAEVRAFLHFRPGFLSDFKPTGDMTNSPSPRTWRGVSDLLALGLESDLEFPTIAGAIGEGAATEFVAFRRVWASMINPDVVLTAPDTAPIPTEPSAMYALATALAARVAPASMGRYCRYLTRLQNAGKGEFAAVSIQSATARADVLALTNTEGYIDAMSGPLGELLIGGAA